MENKKRENAVIFFMFIAAIYFLLSKGFSPGKMLYGLDTFAEHLPFGLFVKRAFTVFHQLPVWMPDIFMGIPLIASANCIVFYPTNLLFYFLPVQLHDMFLVDFIIHMLLAALGMKLFLERIGADRLTALFSGFVYMLAGIFVSQAYSGGWIDLKAAAMIPFVMYFLHMGMTSKKLHHFLTAGLFLGLQVLALGMQVMSYTYACYAAYFVYFVFIAPEGGGAGKTRLSVFFMLSTLFMVLFSSLQFMPTADYMKYSWRTDFTYADFTVLSFHPAETVSLIMPQFFGLFGENFWGFETSRAFTPYLGIMPLFFVFFAFSLEGNRKKAGFFLIMSLAFLILSFGGYTPLYKLLYHVPVFNKFRNPGRFIFMFSFTMTVLSGLGLNNFIKLTAAAEKDGMAGIKRQFWRVFISTAVLAAAMFIVALNNDAMSLIIGKIYAGTGRGLPEAEKIRVISGMIRQDVLYFAAVFLLGSAWLFLRIRGVQKSGLVFISLLFALHFADMRRIDARFISYVSMDEIADKNPTAEILQKDKSLFRVIDMKFLWFPNRNLYYDREFFAGYHGILPMRWNKMLLKEAFYDINVERAFNIKYHMFDEELSLGGMKKILDGPVKLYEDAYAKPRAFFVDRTKRAANEDEAVLFLKTGFSPDTAIVLEDMPFKETKAPGKYMIDMIEYTPARIQLAENADKDGLLVLSNLYFPEWKSKVDGRPVKIYNVNYASMGVALTAGPHKVEFYYDMSLMKFCFGLTALAFIFYLGLIIYERKKP
jgi:hypothetical protein